MSCPEVKLLFAIDFGNEKKKKRRKLCDIHTKMSANSVFLSGITNPSC